MPEIGHTILHHRTLEMIGVGNMEEVYLADDLSLDRKVALKLLPDVFTESYKQIVFHDPFFKRGCLNFARKKP